MISDEGLSVVAIGYYILALLGIAFTALKAAGLNINSDLLKGIALPVVLGAVYWGVHSLRQHITRRAREPGAAQDTDGQKGK